MSSKFITMRFAKYTGPTWKLRLYWEIECNGPRKWVEETISSFEIYIIERGKEKIYEKY